MLVMRQSLGKWHMGGHHDNPRPGFDYWVSFRGQGHYYPPHPDYTINVNGKRVPQDGYITTLLTRYAIDFLEEQRDRDQPFFLYLSHKAVHANFQPEAKYDQKFSSKPFQRPAGEELVQGNTQNLPAGCWIRETVGMALIFRTTANSISSSTTSGIARPFVP